MQKIPRQGPSIGSSSFVPESTLQTMEEMKPHKGQLLNADLAPLSSRQVMDLISAARSTDQLRLNFSETLQKPSHLALHRFVKKGKPGETDEILQLIRESSSNFSPESAQFMTTALQRESEMLELIKGLLESVEQIRNRVVGSQEG